jgi:hypothetical protein
VSVVPGSAIVETETRFFDDDDAAAFVTAVECCAVDRMYKDAQFEDLGTIQLVAVVVQRLHGTPPPSAGPPPNLLEAGLLPVRCDSHTHNLHTSTCRHASRAVSHD